MSLESVKEEYKKEVGNRHLAKKLPMEDLDQMFSEIDKASSMQEFVDVVMSSEEVYKISAAITIIAAEVTVLNKNF